MADRTQTQIQTDIDAKLADNTAGDISAQDVREVLTDLNDSKIDNIPSASEDAAGIVRGATSGQATSLNGSDILAWTVTRIRQVISAALPTISSNDAAAGTSTARRTFTAQRVRQAISGALPTVSSSEANAGTSNARRSWTPALVKTAINAIVPAVFRVGNNDLIGTTKLGTGTPDGNKFLKDDQTWANISFDPEIIGSADYGNTSTQDRYRLHISGNGIDKPDNIPAGEWWGVTAEHNTAGDQIYIFPAASALTRTRENNDSMGTGDSHIAISQTRYMSIAFNAAGKLVVSARNDSIEIGTLTLFRVGHGADPATPVPHPIISAFEARSGDTNPPAGSIAAEVFGVDWAIGNSDYVGAARVIGFKGALADNAANAVNLLTIPAGNYAHGQGNVVIPNGISLADDETYDLRLQVFDADITNPAIDTVPISSHDIVIRAHTPSTAAVHWGRIQYDSNRNDTAAVAAIVFSTDDTTTGDDILNEYEADIPNDSNQYQVYLAVSSTLSQPTGFTVGGQNASASFTDAVDKVVSGTTYKVYIQKGILALNHDDGDGQIYGVTH